MATYIKLTHGREHHRLDMEETGYNGPVLGPFRFVHSIYANELRCHHLDRQKDPLELASFDGSWFYDGHYYGDLEFICHEDDSVDISKAVADNKLAQSKEKKTLTTSQLYNNIATAAMAALPAMKSPDLWVKADKSLNKILARAKWVKLLTTPPPAKETAEVIFNAAYNVALEIQQYLDSREHDREFIKHVTNTAHWVVEGPSVDKQIGGVTACGSKSAFEVRDNKGRIFYRGQVGDMFYDSNKQAWYALDGGVYIRPLDLTHM